MSCLTSNTEKYETISGSVVNSLDILMSHTPIYDHKISLKNERKCQTTGMLIAPLKLCPHKSNGTLKYFCPL